MANTSFYEFQPKACQLDAVWGTQCEATAGAASRRWAVCPRSHCSSRAVWFQWTKVLGVEITGLETRWFEQWHRPSEWHGQSRATVCEEAWRIQAFTNSNRKRANSTPYGARSVKRLLTLHRGGGPCVRAAHCSSRAVWFQWTKVLGVEITGLETRWFEQWHRPSEWHGQSRATACEEAWRIRAYTNANRKRV